MKTLSILLLALTGKLSAIKLSSSFLEGDFDEEESFDTDGNYREQPTNPLNSLS